MTTSQYLLISTTMGQHIKKICSKWSWQISENAFVVSRADRYESKCDIFEWIKNWWLSVIKIMADDFQQIQQHNICSVLTAPKTSDNID